MNNPSSAPAIHFDQAVVSWCRRQFPALQRLVEGRPAIFFDGPAGTQVPQRVIDAMADYLRRCNANQGGLFATSRESDVLLGQVHRGVADLLGDDDPDCVAFGPNMTTLTLALARALGRTWKAGDEIVVTRLEHDANFTPWIQAARDAGATVRYVDVHREDCTLDLQDLRSKLNERTRLVAVGGASNAVGTVNPLTEVCHLAREVGALSFVDAVHYAPHALMDVQQFDCDFLACSVYKFFGPHIGVLWGRRSLLEELEPYKLRPAPQTLPGKWMTGTQNHECLAGTLAAIDYLADLGRQLQPAAADRRAALQAAYAGIQAYEQQLADRLLAGLAQLEGVRVWGITDRERLHQRLPTLGLTHNRRRPVELAEGLAADGIFAWYGHFYALPLIETLGLEPDGMLRIGLVHYNTAEEVDRLLARLQQML